MRVEVGNIYRHYAKKTLYRVIAITKDTETGEARVVYKDLFKFEDPDEPTWDRPARMWDEMVMGADGQLHVRFEEVCDA